MSIIDSSELDELLDKAMRADKFRSALEEIRDFDLNLSDDDREAFYRLVNIAGQALA